jgi:SAM-dependent methyltransferase
MITSAIMLVKVKGAPDLPCPYILCYIEHENERKWSTDMVFHRHWHYVDETERRKWQNPEEILADIGIKPGITFMDIGCGEGFFTLPAAHIIGAEGKIYALDESSEAIENLKKKAADEGLNNLLLKVGKAEDNILCQTCADMIFFSIVLHDFKDPAKVLGNAYKMLKPEGKLINLDWKKLAMSFGPPQSIRFDENTASQMIETAGFKIESVKGSGIYHYLITARR